MPTTPDDLTLGNTMLLSVETPAGEGKHFCAIYRGDAHPTAPSLPPKYAALGYRVHCAGAARLYQGANGRLEAIGPEGGVPVDAVIFNGRRADTLPLVWQSFDWAHGILMSAAAWESSGESLAQWLAMGDVLGQNAPKLFCTNWYRTDEAGQALWPGGGDNMRVLLWVLARCAGRVRARETDIGWLPYVKDIGLEGAELAGSELTHMMLDGLLTVDRKRWRAEAARLEALYADLPDRLRQELATLKDNLSY